MNNNFLGVQFKFFAEKKIFNPGVELFIFRKQENRISQVVDFIVDEHEFGEVYKETPLHLTVTQAQELMDSLWDCGLRPSEGSGSAGALAATENHLKNIQNITDRLLKLVERQDDRK